MAIHAGRRGGGASLRVSQNGEFVMESDSFNFVSADNEVSVSADPTNPSQANIFHPAQDGPADWTLDNGEQGSGIVPQAQVTSRAIATPTSEGTPFFAGTWAGALHPTTRATSLTFNPPGVIRFADNTTTSFRIKISQNSNTLHNYVTAAITANGDYATTAATFTISNLAPSGLGYGANVSVAVPLATLIPAGGICLIEITHLNSGTNNVFSQELFFDAESLVASQSSVTFALNTPATFITSGITHCTTNTTWDVGVLDIDNVFAETAHPTPLQLGTTSVGVPTSNVAFGAFSSTAWNLVDENYSQTVTTVTPEVALCGNATVSSQLSDWTAINTLTSPALNVLLVTKSGTTDLVEQFYNEAYRVKVADVSAWDNTATLTDADAVVACGALTRRSEDYTQYLPHNGTTIINPNYSTSGDALQTYIRRFPDGGTSRQNGILTFTGSLAETSRVHFSLDNIDWFDLEEPYLGGTLQPGQGAVTGATPFPTIAFTLSTHFTTGQIYLRLQLAGADNIGSIQLTWV